MHKEKTDLEKALERFKGYHEAYALQNVRENLVPMRARAKEIAEAHDFIEYQETSEKAFALNVKLGYNDEARIVVGFNDMSDLLEFAVSTPTTRENASIRTTRNADNLFVTTMKSSENPYKLEQKFANPEYIDYLVTKVVEYLNERIENDDE